MPEGHTIHRLAQDYAAAFRGTSPRVTSPQGKFSDAAALLDGAELTRTDASVATFLHVAFSVRGDSGFTSPNAIAGGRHSIAAFVPCSASQRPPARTQRPNSRAAPA